MADDRFAAWSEQLDVVGNEILQLAHIDNVFWQIQALFADNSQIPERETMLDWMARTYVNTLASGLRRLVDSRRDSVSLARLLSDMAQHSTDLTRSRYVQLHQRDLQSEADDWFTELAGSRLDHVPRRRLVEIAARLELAFIRISRFASEQVAHRTLKASDIPTFGEARSALVEAFLVYDWCTRLLHSVVNDRAVPVIQADWLAVFTVPWMPCEWRVPDYGHLDALVQTARETTPV